MAPQNKHYCHLALEVALSLSINRRPKYLLKLAEMGRLL